MVNFFHSVVDATYKENPCSYETRSFITWPYRRMPLISVIGQLIPIRTLRNDLLEIKFNIIFPSMATPPSGLSHVNSNQNVVGLSSYFALRAE
jgi:hypothetical protein